MWPSIKTDLPGLVNEEKEPLQIAYRGIAEIDDIINVSGAKYYVQRVATCQML